MTLCETFFCSQDHQTPSTATTLRLSHLQHDRFIPPLSYDSSSNISGLQTKLSLFPRSAAVIYRRGWRSLVQEADGNQVSFWYSRLNQHRLEGTRCLIFLPMAIYHLYFFFSYNQYTFWASFLSQCSCYNFGLYSCWEA